MSQPAHPVEARFRELRSGDAAYASSFDAGRSRAGRAVDECRAGGALGALQMAFGRCSDDEAMMAGFASCVQVAVARERDLRIDGTRLASHTARRKADPAFATEFDAGMADGKALIGQVHAGLYIGLLLEGIQACEETGSAARLEGFWVAIEIAVAADGSTRW